MTTEQKNGDEIAAVIPQEHVDDEIKEGPPGQEEQTEEPQMKKASEGGGAQDEGVQEDTLESSDDEDVKVEAAAMSVHTEVMEGDDMFPPKVISEKVELAEGVTKNRIKEGRGEKSPSRHSTCFLHYRAWAVTSMHKFEDTWQEGAPTELLLGHEKPALRGLAIAVASMKSGEHALFQVGYKLAYGEEGNFSFPNVPPRADVIYEVELIGFEEPKEGRARGEMTVEERIEAADRRRVDGNELYKEDKVEEAIQQYEMALAYMGDDFMFQLYGKYKDMADSVKIPCHLNMAASLLKLEKYNEAIGHCTTVLAEDKNNTKALYRRGKARLALGQTEAAKADFEAVKKLAPGDKAVVRELRKIVEEDRQLYLKQKELYKGLFPQAPPPPPKKIPWYLILYRWIVSLFRYFLSLFGANRVKTD
ncbi:unnamed protein product [Calypogeia fissa]